ncbi:MAG: twin-arginine translocase subunit TatC [Elusimicrobia bacterium]|nr:twin-arginine translocase subunit TatC [Elusimicrobiota bacterium]
MPGTHLTLVGHLEELRKRLLVCLVSVFLFSIAAYNFTGVLFHWLVKPVGSLVFLAPAEAFLTKVKLAVYSGFFLSIPIVLFEVWRFVVQGLTRQERKTLFWILPSSYFLFGMGVALALGGVVPAAVKFLLAYGSEDLRPLLSAGPYFRFVFSLSLAFGVLFQLPLVLFFLHWLGVVTPAQLAGYRRHIYLGSFVAAAVLTPGPDLFSQILLAVPTIVLFEVSMVFMRWGPLKEKPQA